MDIFKMDGTRIKKPHIFRRPPTPHFAVAAASLSGIPGVRSIYAQEILLWRLSPFIDAPDFLVGEDALVANWSDAVPDAAAHARALAPIELGEMATWPGRVDVRMAAHRRAYAAFFGSETYARLYELGGEAVISLKLQSGASIRIGAVVAATYKHDTRRWAEYLEWLKAESVVDRIESILCPEISAVDSDEWCRARNVRDEVRPFKDWNRSSHLPALLTSQVFDATRPPEGISLRTGLIDALRSGAGAAIIDVLHAMGVSAFVTEPGRAFLESRKDRIDEIAMRPDLFELFAP